MGYDHDKREQEETRLGWVEILNDISNMRVHLARLDERISGHGKLMAGIGAILSLIAAALIALVDD